MGNRHILEIYYLLFYIPESISIKQNVNEILNNAGKRKEKLPEYTRDQVFLITLNLTLSLLMELSPSVYHSEPSD